LFLHPLCDHSVFLLWQTTRVYFVLQGD
jgi:hypothetical protein